MLRKREYQNLRTKEIKKFEVNADESGHLPMYIVEDGDDWKATPKWSLKVVNSGFFFESAHRPTIKHTAPPLDGSDFNYGLT